MAYALLAIGRFLAQPISSIEPLLWERWLAPSRGATYRYQATEFACTVPIPTVDGEYRGDEIEVC